MIWAILFGCVVTSLVCCLLVVTAARTDTLFKKILLDQQPDDSDASKCQQLKSQNSHVIIPDVQTLNFDYPPCDMT